MVVRTGRRIQPVGSDGAIGEEEYHSTGLSRAVGVGVYAAAKSFLDPLDLIG
eukprot:m.6947 g.6947  ORF g.6947 m.6947 type:complete len:52 (-) comp4503_c0_seq1:96-251(-)